METKEKKKKINLETAKKLILTVILLGTGILVLVQGGLSKSCVALLAALIFVYLPKEPQKYHLEFDVFKLLGRILWLLAPLAAYYILQKFYGIGIKELLRTTMHLKGRLNLFILYTFWLGFYAITNRTKESSVLTVVVAYLFGLVNYYVWEFRGMPLVVSDFSSMGTAMEVAGNYSYTLDVDALKSTVYMVSYVCVMMSIKSQKGLNWKKRILIVAGFAALATCFYNLFFNSSFLKDHKIWLTRMTGIKTYVSNGTALSLVVSWTYVAVEKPQGYSVSAVEEVASRYESDTTDTDGKVQPNIIAIMDEAFSDLNVLGELKVSEDVIPFVHQLTENTVKGNLYVSVKGGGTANTEFEFLTGASTAFLPYRSTPYNAHVKTSIPALPTVLNAQGYGGSLAFHPYEGTNYKRNKVYPLLGFDRFISIADLNEEDNEYVRSYVSDESDFSKLISEYESFKASEDGDAPFYCFNVTMQNHSPYKSSTMKEEDMVIHITDEDQWSDSLETYVNLVHKSDEALKHLVEYFEEVEEPTVIVFFGDHQPSLSTEFKDAIYGKKNSELTIAENLQKYETPYLIWANYDIEEEERDMSANYLGAYLMKTIGANMTGYQKYLLDVMEEVPILTQGAYIGADEEGYNTDDTSQYTELLEEYSRVQYNYLFDPKNRVEGFYELKDAG